MAKKTEVSKEVLATLLSVYKEKGTFAAAARETNLSVAVATRIIKENINKANEKPVEVAAEYTGPSPVEFPRKEEVINFWNPEKDWIEEYEEQVF